MKRILPFACLLFSVSAPAALLDVVVTGTLATFNDPDGLLPFSESDALQGFTLSFTLDDTTPDQSADPYLGVYVGAFQRAELRVGGQAIAPWPDQAIQVLPRQPGFQAPGARNRDLWLAQTRQVADLDDASAFRQTSFELILSGTFAVSGPLESDALVPPPWPHTWSAALIQYTIADYEPGVLIGVIAQAAANVTSITVTPAVVPLPPAAWLLATGLAALFAPRLQRRGISLPSESVVSSPGGLRRS